MTERQRNEQLRKEQSEVNLLLAAANQHLIDLIQEAGAMGTEHQLKFANALMVHFNKRTRAYAAAVLAIGDTFEELLNDARKGAGRAPDIARGPQQSGNAE